MLQLPPGGRAAAGTLICALMMWPAESMLSAYRADVRAGARQAALIDVSTGVWSGRLTRHRYSLCGWSTKCVVVSNVQQLRRSDTSYRCAPVRLHKLLQLGQLCAADGLPLKDATDSISLVQMYLARCAEALPSIEGVLHHCCCVHCCSAAGEQEQQQGWRGSDHAAGKLLGWQSERVTTDSLLYSRSERTGHEREPALDLIISRCAPYGCTPNPL